MVEAQVSTLYLSQEVDLKTGCPVALGLTIVQVISHCKYKLWEETLNKHY